MKVEITDRELWLRHVNNAIRKIEDRQAEEDLEYEESWAEMYDQRGWLRYVIGPYSRFPEKNYRLGSRYPSNYAWQALYVLTKIKKALETKGTGAVYLTSEEIKLIL